MTGALGSSRGAGRERRQRPPPPCCPPATCPPPWPCSACLGRLDGRRLGSPGRLGVPGAPGSGGQRHRGPGPPGHWPTLAAGRSPRDLEVDRSQPPPPGRSGKISPSNDHLVKGRAMPPLEPIRGCLCDGGVGGLCAPGCAGVSAPAPLSLARQVRSGLVDAANEPAGSSICQYTTRSCC
jgi:hypothetical protein